MSGVPSEYWWNFHESCLPFLFFFLDSTPVAYRTHTMRPNVITIIIVAPNHMLFHLPSYLGIWQRKILSLLSVFTLSLGICQRRYLPSWFFSTMRRFCSFTQTEVTLTRMFLTTKNEGFYLRERDLVIEAGKMFDQIACNPECARRTTGCCEFLFLVEQ